MSCNSSLHFLLGLIILTLIYRNVQSQELNEVGDTRKNFFTDLKDFVVRIFKPSYSIKKSQGKGNKTIKKNTTIKNKIAPTTTTKKKKPKQKPIKKTAYYVQRRIKKTDMKNKKNGLRSNLFQRDIQKEPGFSKNNIISKNNLRALYFLSDLFGTSFNLSHKTHKDQENFLDSGDNYGRIKRIQKTSDPKTLIIIVTNKKKVHEEIIAREGLSYLDQDVVNQTMFREAYGDACIKVAVRKCYKALQRVNDIVCRTLYKCKSSFKSMFLLKAKTGCIKGFDYTGISSQKKEIKNNSRDQKFKRYIDACIPYMFSERSNRVPKQIHLRNNVTEIVKLILRDQSDKKCQKLSREACVTACYYARDEVCSTYICSRRKKKAFKRECRNECKTTYAIRTDSSDYDSGSSD